MSIFSSIGKVLGTVAKGAVGFATGGIGGAIRAVATPTARPGGATAQIPQVIPQLPQPILQPLAPVIGGYLPSLPGTGNNPGMYSPYQGAPVDFQLIQPGPGTGMVRAGGNTIMSPMGTSAHVPAGYHVNKAIVRATMHPTAGNNARAAMAKQAIVKNRHMNALNPQALKRAERRAHAFLRFAKKMVKYYVPKQPKGKAYISSRRKRK